MISFQCPVCGVVINAPDEAGGRKGTCPKCGQRLKVPTPPATNPKKQTVLGKLITAAEPIPVIPVPSPAPSAQVVPSDQPPLVRKRAQQLAACVGCFLLAIIVLFPPWAETVVRKPVSRFPLGGWEERSSYTETKLGRTGHWVFAPPTKRATQDLLNPGAVGPVFDSRTYFYQVDSTRLIMECAVVVALTIAVAFGLGFLPNSLPSSHPPVAPP